MVKQAEKIRKKSALAPVYGLIIAVGLFAMAFVLVKPSIDLARRFAPGLNLPGPDFSIGPVDPNDPSSPTKITIPSLPRLGWAFGIWFMLLAITYLLVAILVGRDPDSAKNIKLPPRIVDKDRDRRRL